MHKKNFSKKAAYGLIFTPTLLLFLGFVFFTYGESLFSLLGFKKQFSPIKSLVLGGPYKESYNSSFFAEILNLSVDKPTNFHTFDLKMGEKKLENTYAIKEAHLEKIKPHTLLVEAIPRQAIATLGNFSNTLFDDVGILFPYLPYNTPKKLPEVIFGKSTFSKKTKIWGEKIDEKKLALAKELLEKFKDCAIERVDLSKLEESFLGRQEIVVILKEKQNFRVLRLGLNNYLPQIKHYFSLERVLLNKEKGSFILDFRISNVAYLKPL